MKRGADQRLYLMTDYKEQNNNEYKQQAVCPTYTDVTLS